MDPIDWKEIILSILRLWWMCIYGLFCIAESTVRFFLPRDYQRKDVKDEIVLITGGGSGIGRLLCLKFAEKGAKIVTWDIDEEANKRTAQMVAEKGSICRPYTVDLSNPKDIYATAAKVKQEFGKVDILVNNAAIVTSSSLMNSLDDDIIQTFEINALSHFWTVKAFLGDMKLSNKGHIVTIASMAGWIGYNKMVDYCSSKFAAVGFDEALRMELKAEGADGIKTTVVCPFFVNKDKFDGAIATRLLATLTQESVASEIVDATLMNVSVLMLPKIMRLLLLFKLILPEKFVYKVAATTGLTTMMDGHQGEWEEY
ncbi:estradiol 17-beta-dehydrogenase 11-like isoform X2 [Palaemon carinicauda]|uniref:estradiol 17-beta-dehydrogenase 11-like isoform X2 n=1 Tax=Palaemon carinicauda TaxID=392227 RepID=UPI0035B62220